MLSKKAKYAIKALIFLGKVESDEPTLIATIASEESIPRKFLESILLELRKEGYLNSKKGINGGYTLAKGLDQINMADIIRLMHGPIAYVPCVSYKFYNRCDECHDETICGIRDLFGQLRDQTLSLLAATTLADLITRENRLKLMLE